MSYKVTIGNISLKKCIESVFLKVDTPNYHARSEEVSNTIQITGKIGTTESTVDLYLWSLLPPGDPQCYKKVELEVIGPDEQVMRSVIFPNAFVVDYSESFSDDRGVGTFSIFLKQKKDKINTISLGQ